MAGVMINAEIPFEETQHRRLRDLARERSLSLAEVVRRLVDRGLERGLGETAKARGESLLELSGIGRSGLGDLARRHDDYLAEDDPP